MRGTSGGKWRETMCQKMRHPRQYLQRVMERKMSWLNSHRGKAGKTFLFPSLYVPYRGLRSIPDTWDNTLSHDVSVIHRITPQVIPAACCTRLVGMFRNGTADIYPSEKCDENTVRHEQPWTLSELVWSLELTSLHLFNRTITTVCMQHHLTTFSNSPLFSTQLPNHLLESVGR